MQRKRQRATVREWEGESWPHVFHIVKWHKNQHFHSLHLMQILDFEVLEKQPQTKPALHILQKACVSTAKIIPSWLKLRTRSGVALHVWHWQAVRVCAARAQDQQWRRETTPGVGRPLLLGPSHAGGLMLSHSNARNRKLVWPVWNTWERKGGSGLGRGMGVGVLVLMQGWKCIPWAMPFPLGLRPGLSSGPRLAQASRPPHMWRSVNVALCVCGCVCV